MIEIIFLEDEAPMSNKWTVKKSYSNLIRLISCSLAHLNKRRDVFKFFFEYSKGSRLLGMKPGEQYSIWKTTPLTPDKSGSAGEEFQIIGAAILNALNPILVLTLGLARSLGFLSTQESNQGQARNKETLCGKPVGIHWQQVIKNLKYCLSLKFILDLIFIPGAMSLSIFLKMHKRSLSRKTVARTASLRLLKLHLR